MQMPVNDGRRHYQFSVTSAVQDYSARPDVERATGY